MLTREGYVGEATGDNIFLIKNGVNHGDSVPASIGILQGITRDTVIALALASGASASRSRLVTLYDVYNGG